MHVRPGLSSISQTKVAEMTNSTPQTPAQRTFAEADALAAIVLPPHEPTIGIEELLEDYEEEDRELALETIFAYADIHARAALAAQPPAVAAIPEGMALVPIEPTPEIALLLTGYNLADSGLSKNDRREIKERARRQWSNLLAVAAPQPPAGQQDRGEAKIRVASWGNCPACHHDRIPGEACARKDCPDRPATAGEATAAQGAPSWMEKAADEVQEPAPFCFYESVSLKNFESRGHMPVYKDRLEAGIPLYAAPVRGLPLTEERIEDICRVHAVQMAEKAPGGTWGRSIAFARAVEAAHGIKEGS